MNDNEINKFRKYFAYYLIFICICSFHYMNRGHLLESNNSMAEWLINYQGGFGRRGLLGELFFQLSHKLEFSLRKTVLYFLLIIFIIYYFFIYQFFKNIKIKPIFIFCVFSPVFLIYPVAEIEALGRKDILIPLFFLIYCYFSSILSIIGLTLLLIFLFTILLLTHEISIFYLPYFYFVSFLKIKNLKFSSFVAYFFISIFFIFIIYYFFNSPHTDEQINLMCSKLKIIFNENCGMGAFFLDESLSTYIAELNFSFKDVLRALLIVFIGNFALFLLIINSNFKNEKVNFIFGKINFKFSFLIILLLQIIPFFIAVDWGRWINLSSSMTILLYFFCYKNKFIDFKKSKFISYFNRKVYDSKKIFLILLFLICFSWNPKIVYHEDIGSIPIYRKVLSISNSFFN